MAGAQKTRDTRNPARQHGAGPYRINHRAHYVAKHIPGRRVVRNRHLGKHDAEALLGLSSRARGHKAREKVGVCVDLLVLQEVVAGLFREVILHAVEAELQSSNRRAQRKIAVVNAHAE